MALLNASSDSFFALFAFLDALDACTADAPAAATDVPIAIAVDVAIAIL
jgi:hypothetical protein